MLFLFVPSLFTYLSLTLPVSSTCISSIHPSSTCPMPFDTLIFAIYKHCLKSSIMPHILHSSNSISSSFLAYVELSTSTITSLSFTSFFKALFPSFPNFCFPICSMPIYTCFSHLSSWSFVTTLQSNCSLKHWSSQKFLCPLLPEENSIYKQAVLFP